MDRRLHDVCSWLTQLLWPIWVDNQVLTKDSVTVSVDAVVYYRVSGAIVSVANVENAHHSTRLLAQTTLRNVLGTKDLSEILSEREYISNSMQVTISHASENCGNAITRRKSSLRIR